MLFITVKSLQMPKTGLVGSDSTFQSQKQYKKHVDSIYCFYTVLNNPKEAFIFKQKK